VAAYRSVFTSLPRASPEGNIVLWTLPYKAPSRIASGWRTRWRWIARGSAQGDHDSAGNLRLPEMI
jgi:hypothetical protein